MKLSGWVGAVVCVMFGYGLGSLLVDLYGVFA